MLNLMNRRNAHATRVAGGLAAATIAVMALAACGSTGDSGDVTSADVAPMMEPGSSNGEMAMTSDSAAVSTKVEQQVVRTAYLSVRVADVNGAVDSVTTTTSAQGGLVVSEDVTGQGDSLYATLTTQVPADNLDSYLEALKGLGTVDSLSVTSQDVTTQVVDLDARVAALKTSIARLDQLMAQATNVTDLITIEGERTARQAELDSLVAQRKALGEQVAMSTVTVTISALAGSTDWSPPGFIPGLQTGWSALLSLTSLLITVAGFLVPFVIVIAIIVVPLVWWLVRRGRRKTNTQVRP